jgi:hypothetical protein
VGKDLVVDRGNFVNIRFNRIPNLHGSSLGYSEIRADVPRGRPLKWLFHQEKATLHVSKLSTVARVPL